MLWMPYHTARLMWWRVLAGDQPNTTSTTKEPGLDEGGKDF
jgi:hypothetical protein